MKRIKRTISVILAAALTISAFSSFTVSAAATATQQSLPYILDLENGTPGIDKGLYYPTSYTCSNGACVGGSQPTHTDLTAGSTGSLSVNNGMLELKDSDWSGINCKVGTPHTLEFNFDEQTSGTVVFEFKYKVSSNSVLRPQGMVLVTKADDTMVAGWKADGRGDGRPVIDGAFGTKDDQINKTSWMPGTYTLKIEVDIDNKKWTVSGDNIKTDGKADNISCSNASGISKLKLGLTANGDAISDVKIYNAIEATQTETSYIINTGETKQAGISYTPSTLKMNDMVWTSSDTSVATVDSNGLITAVNPGESVITARSAFYGVYFSYNVSVVGDTAEVVAQSIPYKNNFNDSTNFASGYKPMKKDGFLTLNMTDGAYIESDGTRLVMHGNETSDSTGMGQLSLEFAPISSGNYVVELSYGNTNGEVPTVKATDGFFAIYSSDGTKAADMSSSGRGPDGTKMWESGAWLTTKVNNNNWISGGTIRYEIDFSKNTYRAYQNGKLLTDITTGKTDFAFKANDIAKLVFTFSNDGDYIDNIRICKNISATQGLSGYTMSTGDKVMLGAEGLKINAGSIRDFTFSSDNTSVATVAANGKITAKGCGGALITVVNEENNIRFVYYVVVNDKADKITIDQQDRVIYIGEELRLTYSTPKYHTAGEVVWSSSDDAVATVSKDGIITGKGKGKAVITATSEYGAYANYNVKVVNFNDGESVISLKNADFELGSLKNWKTNTYSDGTDPVWSSGGANNSSGCAKLTGHSYIVQSFDNLEEGARYTLSYKMKIDKLESGAKAHMEIESSGYDGVVSKAFYTLTDGWETVIIDFVVPKGCVNPGVFLRIDGNGEVYYDDVKITRQKDITEVRTFSDGLSLNSIVKNAPLTSIDVYYVPETDDSSELIAAVYENGEYKKLEKKNVSGGSNQTITDLINADDLTENTSVSIMNWDALSGMNALGTKSTFLEKTTRSDAYSFFETNRMRGIYGPISDIYNEDIKKLITDSGINTLILNIIGKFYDSEKDVSRDMATLHKVLDDAEELAEETGVKIIPKISFGANGTVANTAYGEFHSGQILVNKLGETVENSGLPCPRSREYWKKQVTEVLSVVASHKKLVGGVVDLEMYSGMNTNYFDTCKCDTCAAEFDSIYGTKVAQQTITERRQYLIDNDLLDTYTKWHKAEIISITSEVRDEIRRYNSDFIIGYMPQLEWISGITEGLGTKDMPAVVFSENEYTGNSSKIYINQAVIKNSDLPAVYATGLWSTKNTGGSTYIAPDDFAAKAVEGAKNSLGYWIYSSNYIVGSGNSDEDNAAYIAAIESANDTIDTKYGLKAE